MLGEGKKDERFAPRGGGGHSHKVRIGVCRDGSSGGYSLIWAI